MSYVKIKDKEISVDLEYFEDKCFLEESMLKLALNVINLKLQIRI